MKYHLLVTIYILLAAPSIIAKIAVTPDYKGTYYIPDLNAVPDYTSSKRVQCHVYGVTTTLTDKQYPIRHNGKGYIIRELTSNIGQLSDGTWVKLVRNKKEADVTIPSYQGSYRRGKKRCYVFALKPESTLQMDGRAVYRVGEEGVLSDGTLVRINCLEPGAMA